MAKNRPSKRVHVGEAHHDSIPFGDDFSVVHAQEGQLFCIGNNFLTAPAEHVPHHEADSAFNSASAWLPIDDPKYALDPDSGWYDEAVVGGMMDQNDIGDQENAPSVAKKRSVSGVEYRYVWSTWMLILGLIFKSEGPMSFGEMSTAKPIWRR